MNVLRWVWYRRMMPGRARRPAWGGHLKRPLETRTLCNRAVTGEFMGGARPPGPVFLCQLCVERAGTCRTCGESALAHFTDEGAWARCPDRKGVARGRAAVRAHDLRV